MYLLYVLSLSGHKQADMPTQRFNPTSLRQKPNVALCRCADSPNFLNSATAKFFSSAGITNPKY